MGLKKMAQKSARKLYHGVLGKTLRAHSEKAVENSSRSGDVSAIERMAIKADLRFSDLAAGDSLLYESADGLKHHARMLHTLHGSDKESAGRSYRNIINNSLTNTEYNQLCESTNNIAYKPPRGVDAAADVYLSTILSSDRNNLLPGATNDMRTIDRAVWAMEEHLGTKHEYTGSRGFSEYVSDQKTRMRQEVQEKIISHWLFDDCYKELVQYAESKGKELGHSDEQVNRSIGLHADGIIESIASNYINKRKKEHESSGISQATNYGMSRGNDFSIHITAKEIEDTFNAHMHSQMALQENYNPKNSWWREKLSHISDTIIHGSPRNAVIARMDYKPM
ncbi:MAG: hypothetical protein R6U32_03155 [Candidatus Woesearchaeota archaeon]